MRWIYRIFLRKTLRQKHMNMHYCRREYIHELKTTQSEKIHRFISAFVDAFSYYTNIRGTKIYYKKLV